MLDLQPSSSSGPIRVDGSELELSNSEFLTQTEILNRRRRRLKQLAQIYYDHYWVLMEELKLKHREYYWEYGKSPLEADENGRTELNGENFSVVVGDVNNGNSGGKAGETNSNVRSTCGVNGCKAKAMALSRFCHMHILSDSHQKLYKGCSFSIKSSAAGPILCGKPILISTVPSYCAPHFQKAEKLMARALKNSGLNVSSASKLAPKFHAIIAEYVCHIQIKRRAAKKAKLEISEVEEDNTS